MYKLIDRASNYGADKRVIVQMDEATFGTVLDLLGKMSKVQVVNELGLNENQYQLLEKLYLEATSHNWYVEGLGEK